MFDPYNIDFSFYVVGTGYTTRQWFSLQNLMPLIVAIFYKSFANFLTIINIFYRGLQKQFYSINKLNNVIEKFLVYVFSFLGSEMETSALTTNECLLIQCTKVDARFIKQKCSTISAQICNKTRK